ncbi:DUF2845 domain-containing protein [Luteibacter flocculans]|uniref:DUF2845 domain-containing protein n=1 Tax=Luteibacter flocculans TaxID=2780091 RepID=A0ABY4T1R3_9GAMM|nr:DUF2845 domain-containing protein [Luteibacter flocculans]URL58893.1 DUF2845 domain-containing protein [Luteibacter flocculans]
MRRTAAFLFLTCLAASAAAADTYRFGSRVISTGDSEGRLREVAGKPDRETPIETDRGGLAGYRLEYYRGGKSVLIEVIGGKVARITQIDS